MTLLPLSLSTLYQGCQNARSLLPFLTPPVLNASSPLLAHQHIWELTSLQCIGHCQLIVGCMQCLLFMSKEQVAMFQQHQEHDMRLQQHATKKHTVVQGCGRGNSCGFKHVIYEAADAAPGEYRPADSGPPPRRGEPSGRGRGRAFRDGAPHPGRWVRNL